MITRSQMRRQLRAQGGIMSVAPGTIGGGDYTGIPMGSRTGFGIVSDIKDRVRRLIPNELADVAVKAAPFIAPFYPGYAAIARGLGRFDQRGSISDALKQGAATYAFGKAAGKLGGAESGDGFFGGQTYSKEGFMNDGAGRLFKGADAPKVDPKVDPKVPGTLETKPTGIMERATAATIDKIPLADKLPQIVKEKLLVGGITSGASALYSYFTGAFDDPQQPGESMEEYMARRNTRVKQQMRGYMDSYYTPLRNPQYAAMSDEEKNNYIDSIVGQGMATGGRVGYQTGGISSANTLAENIARNRAAQQQFSESIAPAQQKTRQKITQRLEDFGNKLTGIVEGARDYTVPVVQGARAFLTGAGEPIITDSMRRDLIERAQAKGGDSGALGYEDYGLKPATKMGRFPGGITDIISDPQAFANAVTAGRVRYEKDPTAPGGYKFKDTKFDFDIKPEDTGLGANLLRGINEGGLKTAIPNVAKDLVQGAKNLLTPTTATAAEIPGAINSLINVNRPTMADVAGPATQGLIPGFTKLENTANLADGDVVYQGPDGQMYGPETYASIAAGMYPNIYDPNRPTMADVAGPAQTYNPRTDEQRRFYKKSAEDDPRPGIKYDDEGNVVFDYDASYVYSPNDGEYGSYYDAYIRPGENEIQELTDASGKKIRFVANAQGRGFDTYDYIDENNNLTAAPDDLIDQIYNTYNLASGGRVGLMGGTMPMGEPRVNQGGITELDFRAKGGFVPVGIKEKADDVPAMLSKNEFVFTADAVRGAGNGSIEKGAQKMYDTMKNLERRVT
jgi:hypothetical protein